MTEKQFIAKYKRQFYHSVCLILNIRKPEELEAEMESLTKTDRFLDGAYPYKGWTDLNESAAQCLYRSGLWR